MYIHIEGVIRANAGKFSSAVLLLMFLHVLAVK